MSLTFHTSLGDLKVELHCDLVPKLTFNVLALAAAGKYDNTKFHRNMSGFMVQGGDSTGTGKGGESIWGGHMNDEFSPHLSHAERGIGRSCRSDLHVSLQGTVRSRWHPETSNACPYKCNYLS